MTKPILEQRIYVECSRVLFDDEPVKDLSPEELAQYVLETVSSGNFVVVTTTYHPYVQPIMEHCSRPDLE